MPTFAAQLPLFRAYDIRGDRQYFTTEFIEALGVAFAHLYRTQDSHSQTRHTEKKQLKNSASAHTNSHSHDAKLATMTVVIGYDVRFGSDHIAHMLANILSQNGLTVVQLGLITTPMMVFWAQRYDGHGIMVTASHSEKNTLGIKWLVNKSSPSSEDIQDFYHSLAVVSSSKPNTSQKKNKSKLLSIESSNECSPTSSIVNLPTDIVVHTYIEAITQVFAHIKQQNGSTNQHNISTGKLDLTVVIDCMHGATSHIAQPLFEQFCQRVIILNDTPDGSFPAGNPDPTEPNRLAELQQTVIVNEADIGLAFDGDGDRLMVVDNRGKVVSPDHLLYLLAQVAISERPTPSQKSDAPQVLFDVKCSHHLPRLLKKNGALPTMSKTGSSIMRQQLQSDYSHAIFAGELSGHFIFNDSYFIVHDDAMYAGLRLLHWLISTKTESSITALLHANINTSSPSTLPLNADSWGIPQRASLPYRLTDITQYLPVLVTTSDTYLPLPENTSNSCSIVEHLATLCHYLQSLHEDTGAQSSTIPADHSQEPALPTSALGNSSCQCFNGLQPITKAQAQQLLPAGTRLSRIDGVRLDFTRGFGVLRQSNTSHSLTVRFAGDSLADMQYVQSRFVELCQIFDNQIAKQIATVRPE